MANWSVLTGRKLKLGSYDEWRKAWQPEDMPPGVSVAEEARQARMALNIESHFANGLYELSWSSAGSRTRARRRSS